VILEKRVRKLPIVGRRGSELGVVLGELMFHCPIHISVDGTGILAR
jgi:hypothetical protein